MKTIGITGGIASGKSAVADLTPGYPHIDADQIAREVVEPGQPGLTAVVAEFGRDILAADGSLDRAKLRGLIARDEDARQRLNGIMHPLIRAAIQEKLARLAKEGVAAAFVSAALMIETGSFRQYDAVILVTAPFETRLQRLTARDGMSEEAARGLMAKQWSDDKKRPFASAVIENDGDMDLLRRRTRTALAQLGVAAPPS